MQDGALLPKIFCWTRFGTEAGETIDRILERKERERRANSGVFYWGVGNSVASGLTELLRRTAIPVVLFSPIRSRPRAIDVDPQAVVRWLGGVTLDGERLTLPSAARITSGLSRAPRYALVCASEQPLRIADHGSLGFSTLRNLVSGNAVGASQVTAVVERLVDSPDGHEYMVAFRARLVAPYFIRLVDPVIAGEEELGDQARAA